jgi:hypothetical protein
MKAEERQRKIAEAMAFIQHRLAQEPRLAADLLDEAMNAGIAEGTLYCAKSRLGVRSRRHGYGGQWSWSLPAEMVLNAQLHETPPP